jgi:AraC-like DNA-binding protein
MKKAYQYLRHDWLVDGESAPTVNADIRNEEWVTTPTPSRIGSGRSLSVQLDQGISLFRVEHKFNATAPKMMVPLAKIEMQMTEPSLMVESIKSGIAMQHGTYPAGEFVGKPGLDVFRYTDRLLIERSIDTSADIYATGLLIGLSSLRHLLGKKESELLLESLELDSCPKSVAHAVPLHVSSHLHLGLPENLTGSIRKLQSQARVLDYLDALCDFFQQQDKAILKTSRAKNRAQEVHTYLLNLDGKVPTLNELSQLFLCSAKTLNNEFTNEYGTSIFNFITTHRLKQAHESLKNSDIPIKTLTHKLGYAHVNHFSAAFKNHFGYAPGSLRKSAK